MYLTLEICRRCMADISDLLQSAMVQSYVPAASHGH
jgi:hypothetical protein